MKQISIERNETISNRLLQKFWWKTFLIDENFKYLHDDLLHGHYEILGMLWYHGRYPYALLTSTARLDEHPKSRR